MRLIEKLPFPLAPEFRIACDEDDLATLATALLFFIKRADTLETEALHTAGALAAILEKVGGEDFRYYRKLADKLKKSTRKK